MLLPLKEHPSRQTIPISFGYNFLMCHVYGGLLPPYTFYTVLKKYYMNRLQHNIFQAGKIMLNAFQYTGSNPVFSEVNRFILF